VQAFSVISLHEKASSKEEGEEQHVYENVFHICISGFYGQTEATFSDFFSFLTCCAIDS